MVMLDKRLLRIDTTIDKRIQDWLEEDIGTGDITTTSIIPDDHLSKGIIHAKEEGVAAGIPVAAYVFQYVDTSLKITEQIEDGADLKVGTVLLEVEGSSASILRAERLALNLLQRLSGIATRTKTYME